MDDIVVRKGEVFDISIIADDNSATTVTFTASKDNAVTINETESFVENPETELMEATIRIDTGSLALGDHSYTLTMNYSDGAVDILPDPDECAGGCDLPTLTICTSNDDSIVS